MKSIMISIQPKWCAKIESGVKTIEVRKTRPKIETPFKCYIYMTLAKPYCYEFAGDGMMKAKNGKVIGEFVCDEIIEDKHGEYAHVFYKDGLRTLEEQKKYGKNNPLYGWYISELEIYDKPKELGEFKNIKEQPIVKPFQSWGYVCSYE